MKPRTTSSPWWTAILGVAGVLWIAFSPDLKAQQPCSFKTGDSIATDRPYYAPTETVKISGSGFDSGCQATLSVVRPDGTSKDQVNKTDKNGAFSDTYVVPALKGTHTIQALGFGGARWPASCSRTARR